MAMVDPCCSLPEAQMGAALEQLTKELETRKKTSEKSEEGCRGLLKRQAAMDYVTGLNPEVSVHPLLAMTLGCPQEQSHHCPRSPSTPVRQ